MSRMKETESHCSSRWDRGESTITLPHLHKASIHPVASQDWGLSPASGLKEEAAACRELPRSARARQHRGGRADVPSVYSQRNCIFGRAGEGPIPLRAARPGWKKQSWRKPAKLLFVHRSEIYNHLSDSLQKPPPAGAATAHSASDSQSSTIAAPIRNSPQSDHDWILRVLYCTWRKYISVQKWRMQEDLWSCFNLWQLQNAFSKKKHLIFPVGVIARDTRVFILARILKHSHWWV